MYKIGILIQLLVPRIYTLSFLMSLLFLFSCNSRGDNNFVTYTVPYIDFEDVLAVDGVVEPVNSTNIVCARGIDGIVVFLIEDGTFVKADELVCVIEDQNLQTRYDQGVTDLENAEANLAKVQANLTMQYALLEAQVKNNEAQAQIASLDSLQLRYATPNQRRIKELELEKSAIEKAKYEEKLSALRIIQQSEIRKSELEIERLRNRLKSAEDDLKKLEIRATKKGLAVLPISWMTGQKLKVGDNVWNNVPILTIPEMDHMKVKIMASERDFKMISVNDSVAYTFDAMPGNFAYGKILNKTPVGQAVSHDSKVKFFEIEASIDNILIMPDPGFTANCRIILKQAKDTIVVPQIAVFDEDSMKVVFVKHKKGYEMRQVTTGQSSQKEIIISEGLERNEAISLMRPKANLIKSRRLLVEKTNVEETRTQIEQINTDHKNLIESDTD